MTQIQALNALKSGLEIVSTCNTQKLLLIEGKLYFGAIGSHYALKVDSEQELAMYKWKLTTFSEHLAR